MQSLAFLKNLTKTRIEMQGLPFFFLFSPILVLNAKINFIFEILSPFI